MESRTAQVSEPTVTMSHLEDIRLQLLSQIEFEETAFIKDCCILGDGKLIFVESEGDKLLIYSEDGRFCKGIPTGPDPCCLAVIDNNTIAVSCRKGKMVNIIDINAGVVKYPIEIGNFCHGVSYSEGKLYVLVRGKGIEAYDVDGKLIRTVQVDVLTYDGYLCCNDGFCYTSRDIESGFIACCDVNGKERWRSDVGNTGVTMDSIGNFYVANGNNHSLYVISADGRRNKRLLSSDDGLFNCCGVFYSKKNDTLLVVTSRNRRAALYRVI